MSLDEAARVTCIGKSYLEALESDRYEQLPNPAYVKGIIRSYAQAVGIPPDPLIAGYEQGAAPDETADERTGGSAHPPGRKQWLLLLILGLVICAGYMLAQRDGGTGRPLPSGGEIMSAAVPATRGYAPPDVPCPHRSDPCGSGCPCGSSAIRRAPGRALTGSRPQEGRPEGKGRRGVSLDHYY